MGDNPLTKPRELSLRTGRQNVVKLFCTSSVDSLYLKILGHDICKLCKCYGSVSVLVQNCADMFAQKVNACYRNLVLLQAGAETKLQNNDKKCPLDVAAMFNKAGR